MTGDAAQLAPVRGRARIDVLDITRGLTMDREADVLRLIGDGFLARLFAIGRSNVGAG